MLQRHRASSGLLAGRRDALQQSRQNQEDRRQNAGLIIGRQATDDEGRKSHEKQREGQHLLAAELVADMAENDGAQRPHDIGNAKGREGGDRRRLRVFRRKEDFWENERRRRAVYEEIIILDGTSLPARKSRALGCLMFDLCFHGHSSPEHSNVKGVPKPDASGLRLHPLTRHP